MEIDIERIKISALNRIYGFKPREGLALLERYGSAAAVPGIPEGNEAAELEWLYARGHRLLSCLDEDYPPLLAETPDHPIGLYYSGISSPREIFGYRRAIAIVGTRDISSYGAHWCREIVRALARTADKPVIVSGFAIGTDIIAQTEALEAGLPTIGVMPVGPDNIYPSRHRDIAMRLVSTTGCALVSDYPPGTTAMASNFIRRNRIIAGLADAVILIESKRKGGGLITMDFAVDYGRDTFALPGRIEDSTSEGCNNLIRRSKAQLLSDPESLVEDLGLGLLSSRSKIPLSTLAAKSYGTDSLEYTVFEHIRLQRGITPDDLCLDLNLPYPRIITALTRLQTDGFVNSDILQRYYINTR